ncbi:hypothetical protein DTL21_12295 [Bremerella cremea]|uniref:Uncharacterized protein n=1 Tax=Blastopirellula marina TaxID=124 RepID=A0A2S8FQ45_9BACT|nr:MULTISPECIES: hypothetical protein [Pirellulaceae]PQO34306.1 hypothetical protein C5Y83_12290 [Blastopirellula marina]RCS46802.1 hypothetical protein DTL21_12295 [Bremerella cremea]
MVSVRGRWAEWTGPGNEKTRRGKWREVETSDYIASFPTFQPAEVAERGKSRETCAGYWCPMKYQRLENYLGMRKIGPATWRTLRLASLVPHA